MDLGIHAGKYLAKDVGATFELRRTFSNGWMVGLWATLTTCRSTILVKEVSTKGCFFVCRLTVCWGVERGVLIATVFALFNEMVARG